MTLTDAAIRILNQLSEFLDQLDPSEFTRPSVSLSGSTIDQPVRHTLEFFSCLESGCRDGIVNDDKRDHDRVISSDKGIATARVGQTSFFVSRLRQNKKLTRQVGCDPSCDVYQNVTTNIYRKLTYNIEHAVRHMAIIKIAVQEIAPYIALAKHFGISASTLRYGLVPNFNSNH